MHFLTDTAKENREVEKLKDSGAEVNFMGGISYQPSALETLKLVTASSIFGEPAFYRDGQKGKAYAKDGTYRPDRLILEDPVLPSSFSGRKTSEIMEMCINEALSEDFGAVLDLAVSLRREYFMRLNPQVIMVRAAMHPGRTAFNETHPGRFAEVEEKVMRRADEPASQFAYYLYANGSKHGTPNVLKKAWKRRLESASRYELAKYKNSSIGMIDTVRISHASGKNIDELMKAGTVKVGQQDKTWENLRSEGKSWKEILDTVNLPHMALLRSLRGIFSEIDDVELCARLMKQLEKGVLSAGQFPFRYYSAYNAIKSAHGVNHVPVILDSLETCADIACDNMPRLSGKTMCLSDNSGSAWGTIPSEYGSVRIAEIDNLSSVITAHNSDEGYVGKFGDRLKIYPISHRGGILQEANLISQDEAEDVGGGTENGIWLFFRDAIRRKEHWDNIFIYSDQQAGHGGLYGTPEDAREYVDAGFAVPGNNRDYYCQYIDVAKIVRTYRQVVNPKVNVYMVQTAGYPNVLIPEYEYRTSILTGWTGKEAVFADTVSKIFDEADAKRSA